MAAAVEEQKQGTVEKDDELAGYFDFIDTFFTTQGTRLHNDLATSPIKTQTKAFATRLHEQGVLFIRGAGPSLCLTSKGDTVALFWVTICSIPDEFSIRINAQGLQHCLIQRQRRVDTEEKLMGILKEIASRTE